MDYKILGVEIDELQAQEQHVAPRRDLQTVQGVQNHTKMVEERDLRRPRVLQNKRIIKPE